MSRTIRTLAKRVLPKPLAVAGWATFCRLKSRRARAVFARASTSPEWLGRDELEILQRTYPLEPMTYGYDTVSIERRAWQRARQLVNLVPHSSNQLNRFLDLGCWDGMLCYALQKMGKTAVGVDIRAEGFMDKVVDSGVPLLQMDATNLAWADNSFDVAFSYNSFEHFPDPEGTLREALRVVRPGGYIFLDFGPLYLSPKGAHQFHAITVPYCQCLFTETMLTEFARDKGLELTGFYWMNGWSITQFRQLWQKYAFQMETVSYYETYNADHVDLITRYPGCFKSKTDNFDDLIVAYVEALFRKVS